MVASEKAGSVAVREAALQAEHTAQLAWTGRSFVLASLQGMEVGLTYTLVLDHRAFEDNLATEAPSQTL